MLKLVSTVVAILDAPILSSLEHPLDKLACPRYLENDVLSEANLFEINYLRNIRFHKKLKKIKLNS